MALFAVSFNLLLGYTGLVSFGHAAYFSIGAHTTALVLKRAELSALFGIMAAPLASALAAVIIGFCCVRLSRIYFARLTLAFSQIIWAITFKISKITKP